MDNNRLYIINGTKYGDVAVNENSLDQLVYDDYDNLIDVFPAGLVCRWMPKGKTELEVKVIENKFLNEFDNTNELKEYINSIEL